MQFANQKFKSHLLTPESFKGIKLAVGILILDAALKMIQKMQRKPILIVIMVCAATLMMVTNIFSFGGAYAAIPLIRDTVLSYGWLNDELLTYMIAVSESTPGPIMVNLATYVGASQAGFLGAIVATFAVVLPSFLIVLAVTAVFYKAIKNKYVRATLQGIKPGMIGVIFATGCWMIIKNLFKDSFGEISIRAVIITAILG